MAGSPSRVFITGGTGYMGRRLTGELLARDYEVHALARPGSEKKLPAGSVVIPGNALDGSSYAAKVKGAATFVHLIGVAHPNPRKGAEFRSIDLVAGKAAIAAASAAGVEHFVYVSVAHPAPIMQAYIDVRMECEEMIRSSGMNATILRPWYVLGPSHRWPYCLLPAYWLMERLPRTRESALRLGLVTLNDMIAALVAAVIDPCRGIRIYGVPQIRQLGAQ